ncbi:ribulose-phosphate 3-epimerase [Lignipirellula cremea]|uniref:Ribulose-phosphate 3-epimerase n=1 Tax=Lignipirellula cremea TaxID=2528010 RepID=A0A518DWX9_9BACT|nr:ribulose-phosphate 3-epimerase [Lignipirellula cremea]QDU96337.1 Ribulose-phosphate 3-epimerase [Lignipirellula cremea]
MSLANPPWQQAAATLLKESMRGRELLPQLQSAAPVILPSLLLCDFGNLEREVARLEAAGVRAFHLDVMDGNFVPNLTYGMPIVAAMRRLTRLPIDVHLMISNPGDYISQFAEAGADLITFHIEATSDPRAVLTKIGECGVAAGIALNPGTPIAEIEECIDLCDLILVMSVDAGFGGQKFNPVALDKLRFLKERVGERVLLEVDGGVSPETIASCASAGAQLFVVGSAIFKHPDYSVAIADLASHAAC